MLCKKVASMMTGISIDQEICLIVGQVPLSLILLEEKLPDGCIVREETDKTAVNMQARTLDQNGKKC